MLWTIALDGAIGFFETYRHKAAAQAMADRYAKQFPDCRYTVEPEDSEDAAYAEANGAVNEETAP
jgi:hypothetical protein